MDTKTSPVRLYTLVFLGLGALTLLTVGLSYLHLPHRVAIPLAIAIATTKCTLIASVFMHLKWDSKVFRALLFLGLFFILFLVFSLIPEDRKSVV